MNNEKAIRSLLTSLLTQIKWRTDEGIVIHTIVHNVVNSSKQILLCNGDGWSSSGEVTDQLRQKGICQVNKKNSYVTWEPWSLLPITKTEVIPIRRKTVVSTTSSGELRHVGGILESMVDLIREYYPGTDEIKMKSAEGQILWLFTRNDRKFMYAKNYRHGVTPEGEAIEIYSCPVNGEPVRGLEPLYPINIPGGGMAGNETRLLEAKKLTDIVTDIRKLLLSLDGKMTNLGTLTRENGVRMDYLNDNILTLNQRMDKMSEERILLAGTRDPRNRGLMKRKAAEPDTDWQITPIPRIARKKRKAGNLLSPTQVSSAPPTPYKWEIPPTPPRGEVGNEGIEPISCDRCQVEFSSTAVLGLHECNVQPPAEKRKRGRPKKQRVEDSLIDISGNQSVKVNNRETTEGHGLGINSEDA